MFGKEGNHQREYRDFSSKEEKTGILKTEMNKMKQKMWKRALLTFLCLALLVSLCACGGKPASSGTASKSAPSSSADSSKAAEITPQGSGDPTPMRYVAPGSDFPMQDQVLEKVNEKLQADGINIEVQLQRIPWDAWDQKTQLMISTGEEFEMLHVMQDLKQVGTLYSQGALLPLNEYLESGKYDKLKNCFSDNVWKEVTGQGQILAVPAMSTANQAKSYGDITYRKDIADKLGLKVPTTVDELIDFAKAIKADLEKETGKPIYAWGGTGRPAEWYLRSLQEDYFYVDTALSLVKVDQQGNVSSYIESEDFKNSCKIYERMNAEGLINPDILSLGHEYGSNEIKYGRWAIGFDMGTPLEYEQTVQQNVPGAEIGVFQLAPDKGDFIYFYTYNCNAVPTTSKHPEAALDFLQWLYSGKENYDLFMYGIEGETYNATDDTHRETLRGEDGNPLYQYDEWQIGYQPVRRWEAGVSDELVKLDARRRDLDETAVVSVATGFMFDATPVADAAANLSAEVESVLAPLKCGLVSYEEGFDSALSTLKAAGLDEYLTEFERQFKEYLAQQK